MVSAFMFLFEFAFAFGRMYSAILPPHKRDDDDVSGSYLSIVHRYFVCVMQLMNVFKTLNKENFMGQPFYLT